MNGPALIVRVESRFTHRAKLLMMVESAISLLTLIIVVARAINVLPG